MPAEAETSEDAVLGGRLVLRQPLRGHRFGHDAILLAAATAAQAGEQAIELGAGVGAAGLANRGRQESTPRGNSIRGATQPAFPPERFQLFVEP